MDENAIGADSSTDYDNLNVSTSNDNDTFDYINTHHNRRHRRQMQQQVSMLKQQQQQQQQQLCDQCLSECRSANSIVVNMDMYDQSSSSTHGSQIMTATSDIPRIRPARQTRSYRIIDNDESQRILQQIANEKMAEMEIARKTSKYSRRKLSAIKSSQSLLLYANIYLFFVRYLVKFTRFQ
uniref:KID domain-containing protein n=1 Tax=Syphacia muris TaxID=451379 RepID=A0A0N5ANQ7_9BILA